VSLLSPWVLYSLLGGGAGAQGSPFAGANPGAFGSLQGSTITAPMTPPPAPPPSSAMVGPPTQLATAVPPMPVSSGVPAPTAPPVQATQAPLSPAPGTGWTPYGGGFAWTGQGLPQNDPYGRPLPSGWNTFGQLGTGSTYLFGVGGPGIGFGPYGGAAAGAAGGGMGGGGAPQAGGGVNQGQVGAPDVSSPQVGGPGALPT